MKWRLTENLSWDFITLQSVCRHNSLLMQSHQHFSSNHYCYNSSFCSITCMDLYLNRHPIKVDQQICLKPYFFLRKGAKNSQNPTFKMGLFTGYIQKKHFHDIKHTVSVPLRVSQLKQWKQLSWVWWRCEVAWDRGRCCLHCCTTIIAKENLPDVTKIFTEQVMVETFIQVIMWIKHIHMISDFPPQFNPMFNIINRKGIIVLMLWRVRTIFLTELVQRSCASSVTWWCVANQANYLVR